VIKKIEMTILEAFLLSPGAHHAEGLVNPKLRAKTSNFKKVA
jgi:hypothetical protein